MKIKKIFFSTFVFLAVFGVASFLKIVIVDAAVTMVETTGWPWGGSDVAGPGSNTSGIGWISFNSADAGAGGATYNVEIPTNDGPVLGYARIDNLESYIDFAPRAGCPTEKYPGSCDAYPTNSPGTDSSDVMRKGDEFVGWARIVNIAVAHATGKSGSENEDGWISMKVPNVSGYSVTIDPATGLLGGSAWAGNVLGAINFDGGPISVKGPVSPKVVITANPTYIDIISNPTWNSAGVPIDLTWTITGTTCNKLWDTVGPVPVPATGSDLGINQKAPSMAYTLRCADGKDYSANVATGCYADTCGGATHTCNHDLVISNPQPVTDPSRCKRDCTQGGGECNTKTTGIWKEVTP